MSRPALATALALLLAAAAPAAAGGLPPLGLERGQGSAGGGLVHLGGDVALADGLTLGLDAYGFLFWNAANARASWTVARGPWGAAGLLAAGGVGTTAAGGTIPFGQLGPVYESPPAPVRLRVALGSGVWAYGTRTYASGRFLTPVVPGWPATPDDPVVAEGTRYELGLQPAIEVVIPLNPSLELTLLGNGLAGLYGRW